MQPSPSGLPARAWIVTFAGTAVNLCLGVLYAWSVWKGALIGDAKHPPGAKMTGVNAGWEYLTDAQGTWAYAICGFVFALAMIPGGRLQDRFGPKLGATAGGLCLAAGCVLAGLMKSYAGLLLGFGLLGGLGMGLGYSAATPAAVKWFGQHQRGLVVGLVVGGYGGAAIYISPLGKWLIEHYGISGSFIGMGVLFALVVIVAGQLLAWPPAGYQPPARRAAPERSEKSLNAPRSDATRGSAEQAPAPAARQADWSAGAMLRTWQFYALVFLFIGSAQSGLLVIANATPMLNAVAKDVPFFVQNAWLLASFGGFVNAIGRVGTGSYSDRLGRGNAYLLNGLVCAGFLFALPSIMAAKNVPLLFVAVGVAYWQYGGGLALLPSLTADFFGAKNLGFNYGLVFLGWGVAFFVPQLAGYLKDKTGSLDYAFYLSGGLLLVAVALSVTLKRPPPR